MACVLSYRGNEAEFLATRVAVLGTDLQTTFETSETLVILCSAEKGVIFRSKASMILHTVLQLSPTWPVKRGRAVSASIGKNAADS